VPLAEKGERRRSIILARGEKKKGRGSRISWRSLIREKSLTRWSRIGAEEIDRGERGKDA